MSNKLITFKEALESCLDSVGEELGMTREQVVEEVLAAAREGLFVKAAETKEGKPCQSS